ncbi:MAG: ribokinase [Phycisphaerae bacterium]|nr:MAG: ribokinase [Phycisphaerae bacterium]
MSIVKTSKKILVVGSANIDLVTRVPRCPKPGESLVGTSFTTVPGGKGANQAVAAARLGAETTFVGCVGDDAFGAMLRKNLEREGVNVDHVKMHPAESTGTACIYVMDDGNNAIVVTPAANHGLSSSDIEALRPVIAAHDVVLTQLEIPLETVETLLRVSRDMGVFSILDAGPVRDTPIELLRLAGLVSPNETETEAFTGAPIRSEHDAAVAAERFHASGTETLVIKLGARGALLSMAGVQHYEPAFAVNAIDTVAAGDAFTAALALVWSDGTPARALQFANAAGALATTKTGAQDAMPTRQAIEQFLMESST